jgi:predicted PurR-regulated permease PerM
MPPEQRGPWSQRTKDRWFLILLAVVTVLVLRLALPYAAVLMFASVVAIVTYPVYRRIHEWTDRPTLSAILTTSLFGIVVIIPMTWMATAFARQAVELGQKGVDFMQTGGLDAAVDQFHAGWSQLVPASLTDVAPDGTEVLTSGLQSGVLSGLTVLTNSVPQIVATTAGIGVDTVVFVVAVATLYVQGPAVLGVIRDLAPLDEEYVDTLFGLFQDLSRRVVTGTAVTAMTQGLVATAGYAIAGVEGLVFWGMLTSLFALVPVVGSTIVYLPLCLLTFINRGVGWALFLLAWNLMFTSQIDNVLRPFFLRGENNVHPLIVFVAVLGGLAWLGVPGALVGPIIVVVFAALLIIFRRDFLGRSRVQRG